MYRIHVDMIHVDENFYNPFPKPNRKLDILNLLSNCLFITQLLWYSMNGYGVCLYQQEKW